MNLLEEPLLTWEMQRSELRVAAGAAYVFGVTQETRSTIDAAWAQQQRDSGVRFYEVREVSPTLFAVIDFTGVVTEYSARDEGALGSFIEELGSHIILDITGLPHIYWAPILRAAVSQHLDQLHVVYVEPLRYTRSANPTQGAIYDLSSRSEGISPIPGFLRLEPADPRVAHLVPLLGFEGSRLDYVIEATEYASSRIVPIVGVPGFQIEHPFSSYAGNQNALGSDYLHRQVRLAKANCPFDAFHAIRQIWQDYGVNEISLAPIGTKPHGLAAILFALSNPDAVDIIYDHPVKAPKRTSGEGRLCLYDVSSFLTCDLYLWRGQYSAD